MNDTSLLKSRPLKKVFKAPVISSQTPGESKIIEKNIKKPSLKDDDTSIKSKSVKGQTKSKPVVLPQSKQVKKDREVKKVKSLTDAEYEEIFSSVLSLVQDDSSYVNYQKQNINLNQGKHKLDGVRQDDTANRVKKQKFDLTDDSFQTPVFEDLAVKNKKKTNKKKKVNEIKAKVSKSSAGAQTPPNKKASLPPISPWGSHFAKLNSQGSSMYKPSDESQSIVGSLFEDDEDLSSSDHEEKPEEKSADSKSLCNSDYPDNESNDDITEKKCEKKEKQKIKLKNIPESIEVSKDVLDRLEMLHEDRNVGLWVICDNKSCEKLRYLSHVTDPLDLPAKWFCSMNPDTAHNSCDKSEHGPSKEEDDYLIHNMYNAGSIVWARVDGYPWWPAMVDDCPDFEMYYWLEGSMTPTWYHVVFFDEGVSRAWLKPHAIAPFTLHENDKIFQQTKMCGVNYKNRLAIAKKQAAEASLLSTYEKLKTYSFVARYKKPLTAKAGGKPFKKVNTLSTKDAIKHQVKGKPFKEVKTVSAKAVAIKHQVKGKKKKNLKEISKVQQKNEANIKKTNCAADIAGSTTKKTRNKRGKYGEAVQPARKTSKASQNKQNTLLCSEKMTVSDKMFTNKLSQEFISEKNKKSLKKTTGKTETSRCNEVNNVNDEVRKELENAEKYVYEFLDELSNEMIMTQEPYKEIKQANSENNADDLCCEVQSQEVGSSQGTVCETSEVNNYKSVITSTSQENTDVSLLSQQSLPFDYEE